jgi:hypothetical protein
VRRPTQLPPLLISPPWPAALPLQIVHMQGPQVASSHRELNGWTLVLPLAHRSCRGGGDEHLHGLVVVSSGCIAGAWRACSCRVGGLGHDQGGRERDT